MKQSNDSVNVSNAGGDHPENFLTKSLNPTVDYCF